MKDQIKQLEALEWYYDKRLKDQFRIDAQDAFDKAVLKYDEAMNDIKTAPDDLAKVRQQLVGLRQQMKVEPYRKKIAALKKLKERLDGVQTD